MDYKYYALLEAESMKTYFEVPSALRDLLSSDGWGCGHSSYGNSIEGTTLASPYDAGEIEGYHECSGESYEIKGVEYLRDMMLKKRPNLGRISKDKEFVAMVFDDACADALFDLFHG